MEDQDDFKQRWRRNCYWLAGQVAMRDFFGRADKFRHIAIKVLPGRQGPQLAARFAIDEVGGTDLFISELLDQGNVKYARGVALSAIMVEMSGLAASNRAESHSNPNWCDELITNWNGEDGGPIARSLQLAGLIYRSTEKGVSAKAWHLVRQGCRWADEVFNEEEVWAFVQMVSEKLSRKTHFTRQEIIELTAEPLNRSSKWRRRFASYQTPEYRAWLRKQRAGKAKP